MIQRIQSLYLLVVTILMAVMLFAPLAYFTGEGGDFRLAAFGLEPGAKSIETTTSFVHTLTGVLIAVAGAWTFATIFFFRRRRVQMRLCAVGIILLLGVQAAIIYLLMRIGSAGFVAKYAVADIFPLIGIVLTYLAQRAIKRDETLVRSLDRIR